MPDTLLIRFAPDDLETVTWLRVAADGRPAGELQVGLVEQAAADAEGCRVVVLVPGTDVTLTEARVPTQSRQRVYRAVPFALEDQLADEIETLHFVVGPRADSGLYPVAVVRRECMDAWLAALTAANLQPQLMLPDTLAVPRSGDAWSLLLDADVALLRSGPWSGFAMETELLPALLQLASGGEETPRVLHCYTCTPARAGFPATIRMVDEGCEEDVMQVLASGVAGSEAINLLQGSYSRSEQLSRLWKPWRATAALLLVGVILHMAQLGTEYYRLDKARATLAAEIEQVYRAAFPDARKVVNPQAQMKQKLTALRRLQGKGSADFLTLLAQAGGVLHLEKGVDINGVSFRDGRLDVEVLATDLQTLDRLKQQLVARGGLSVEIQSATASAGSKVQGRLRIQGAES
jgi:general secretion pathway protein L